MFQAGLVSLLTILCVCAPLFKNASADAILVTNARTGEIDEVAPSGSVTTFASGFQDPLALKAAPDGTLYVLTQRSAVDRPLDSITKVAPSGQKTLLVGISGGGMAVDHNGVFYVNDSSNFYGPGIVKMFPDGTSSVLLSSTSLPGVTGIALDVHDDLYVATTAGDIDRVASDGSVNQVFSVPFVPGPIAVDHNGNIFVGSLFPGFDLVKVSPQGGQTQLPIVDPYDLAVDSDGNVFASNQHGSIFEIKSDGTVSTYATTNFALGITVLVPEPSTLALAALGFAALVAWRWRRRIHPA